MGNAAEGFGGEEARGFTTSSVTRFHGAPNGTFSDSVLLGCVGSSVLPADANVVAEVNEILGPKLTAVVNAEALGLAKAVDRRQISLHLFQGLSFPRQSVQCNETRFAVHTGEHVQGTAKRPHVRSGEVQVHYPENRR